MKSTFLFLQLFPQAADLEGHLPWTTEARP